MEERCGRGGQSCTWISDEWCTALLGAWGGGTGKGATNACMD